jgi:hypothetical protein
MFKSAYTWKKYRSMGGWVGIVLVSLFLSYSIVQGVQLLYFICGIVLAIGFVNPLIGLLIAYTFMNDMFNLIPQMVSETLPINKMWDFGFILMLLYAAPLFLKNYKPYTIRPTYLKFLFLFIGICFLSFLYTLFSYKYLFVDALRMFRPYFGYLTIFIFLQFFLKREKNVKQFFNVLYFISLGLLILYHVQFIIQRELFFGHQQTYMFKGIKILRSIPNFMFVSYMFFWYNLAAWLQGKPILKYGKIFSLLAITGIMISFTRGFYLSFSFATFLLLIILFLQRTVLVKRIVLSLLLVVYFILFASVSDYLRPVIERAASIKTAIFTEIDRDTFGYRLKLLESRYEMTMDKNPLLGIGFVHNKYGRDFGKFPGNYNEATGSPSLWSADIAWANIIYQTGLIGLASCVILVFLLVWY